MADAAPLLDREFLEKLERLTLHWQKSFGGLVGGFAGLYQVNAYVPKSITPGDAVPLVVTVAGFESAPVTVSVK